MSNTSAYRCLEPHMHLQSPIHYSNVALIDPVTKAAVRVSRQYLEDGTKVLSCIAKALLVVTQRQQYKAGLLE